MKLQTLFLASGEKNTWTKHGLDSAMLEEINND
jgi:hypothetical protein